MVNEARKARHTDNFPYCQLDALQKQFLLFDDQ